MQLKFIPEDESIELCDDEGNFIAGWNANDISLEFKKDQYIKQGAVVNMLNHAFEAGKRARSEEIKKLIL